LGSDPNSFEAPSFGSIALFFIASTLALELAFFSNTRFFAQLVDQFIGYDDASCRKRLKSSQRMRCFPGSWM
jgi:hypothetical protein